MDVAAAGRVLDRRARPQRFLWTPILSVLGQLQTFLGSRSDLAVFHTVQPKKAFVLRQEMQPVRDGASRTEGSRPSADAD